MAILQTQRPLATSPASDDEKLGKRTRHSSKPKAAKKAAPQKSPGPPKNIFICEGGSCDLVRRVLVSWGWSENEDAQSSDCLLKWTFRSRDAEKVRFGPWQLINHFHGSYYLSNKAFLGQCLQSCDCAARFFPRQHDLRNVFGMRCFLRDFVVTQAEQALSVGRPAVAGNSISAREAALRVLRRYKDWQEGSQERSERLLRCPHECHALLGEGCQLPRKMSLHQRAHVDLFLSQYMKPGAECVICSAEHAPSTSRGAAGCACASRLRQEALDGPGNVWALKEPCVQKGKGVTVLAGLSKILTAYETHRAAGQGRDCVAQKYIERPLLVPRSTGPAKCDLRAWVLVLDWNPLTAFVHPEVYFRVATLPFELDSMAPNAHKTNCRDEENRTPMKVLFEQMGPTAAERWQNYTWPRLLDAVRAALLATRPAMYSDKPKMSSPSAFELFGLDFGLDDSWRPWLFEINTSPCMLDDCKGDYEEEIRSWAWEATDSLLRLSLAYHDGWQPPPHAELFNLRASPRGGDVRLFGEETQCPNCLGAAVNAVPECLVSGLSLGDPCGRWRLILREKGLDDATLRQSRETLMRRIYQGMSTREASVSRLLREWLLPVGQADLETVAAAWEGMSKTSPKLQLKRAFSQPARRTPQPLQMGGADAMSAANLIR